MNEPSFKIGNSMTKKQKTPPQGDAAVLLIDFSGTAGEENQVFSSLKIKTIIPPCY
jgi:hypothetical protein